MSQNKKPALGRGLSALLENAKTDITTKQTGEGSPVVGSIAIIQIKNPSIFLLKDLRGFDQIRTGVGGFADLCLAARPRNPYFGIQRYENSGKKKVFYKRFLK